VLEVFFDSVHLLGVRSDPPGSPSINSRRQRGYSFFFYAGALLVECLSKRRLVDHAVACRVFSYLASCANSNHFCFFLYTYYLVYFCFY
jgi:hypothetical protein